MRTRHHYPQPKTGFFEFAGKLVTAILGLVAVVVVGWLALVYIVVRWL